MEKLKLGVLGSGASSNVQSSVDVIEAGELPAEIRLFLTEVRERKVK